MWLLLLPLEIICNTCGGILNLLQLFSWFLNPDQTGLTANRPSSQFFKLKKLDIQIVLTADLTSEPRNCSQSDQILNAVKMLHIPFNSSLQEQVNRSIFTRCKRVQFRVQRLVPTPPIMPKPHRIAKSYMASKSIPPRLDSLT